MYGVPLIYAVPFVILWLVLDIVLLDICRIDDKLAKKHARTKATVKKWIHGINATISFFFTLFLFLILKKIR